MKDQDPLGLTVPELLLIGLVFLLLIGGWLYGSVYGILGRLWSWAS